jgi:hypothetical protein
MAGLKPSGGLGDLSVASSFTFVFPALIPVTGSLAWNGASGDWSNAANWSVLSGVDHIPNPGDDVSINAAGNYLLTVTGAQSVDNLTLDAAGATLAVIGPIEGQSGTLAVGGSITGGGGTLDLTMAG